MNRSDCFMKQIIKIRNRRGTNCPLVNRDPYNYIFHAKQQKSLMSNKVFSIEEMLRNTKVVNEVQKKSQKSQAGLRTKSQTGTQNFPSQRSAKSDSAPKNSQSVHPPRKAHPFLTTASQKGLKSVQASQGKARTTPKIQYRCAKVSEIPQLAAAFAFAFFHDLSSSYQLMESSKSSRDGSRGSSCMTVVM